MLLVFAIVAFTIWIIWKDIYDSTDHSFIENSDTLSPDAQIVDFERKEVGTKGHRRYRTVIFFDDGFKYISHKTDVNNMILSYRISISRETNIEILQNAIAAHDKAIAKRDKKLAIDQKKSKQKIADTICAKIWLELGFFQNSLFLPSSVEADIILYSAFYYSIENVLLQHNITREVFAAFLNTIKKMTGGNDEQKSQAVSLHLAYLKGFREDHPTLATAENIEFLCFNAFHLAYNYEIDEYLDMIEKPFVEAVSKVTTFTSNLFSASDS